MLTQPARPHYATGGVASEALAPADRRRLSPWPLYPDQSEPARQQAARLLAHVADRLVNAGTPTDGVWAALAAGDAPRWTGDPKPSVEQHARWIAARALAAVCRGYAHRDEWDTTMTAMPAQDGDWVHGLVTRCDRDDVVAALTAAAAHLRGHHAIQ